MATSPQESSLKKGPWTPEEDQKLVDCIHKHGHGSWKELPKLAGLNRCGKSCRLRWTNYLRPDIKRGAFSDDEETLIIDLHAKLGNKWSAIASYLPGRTDNEIKNFWNTHLKKKLLQNGIDPITHMPSIHLTSQFLSSSGLRNLTWENVARFQTDAARVAKVLLIGNILQLLNPGTSPRLPMEAFNHSSESPHLNSRLPFDSINLQLEGLAPKPEHNTLTCQQGYDSTHQLMFQNEIETNIFIGGKSNEFGEPVPMYTDSTIPDLVSSSPRHLSKDEAHNNIISLEKFSNLSSTSKTFEDLGDLMDDEASNYYWEQILNQGSISP